MRRLVRLAVMALVVGRPVCGLADDLRGLAIADPATLRELDLREQVFDHTAHPGFGLHQMLDPAGPRPLSGERLFGLPAMAEVREALDAEFDRYPIARPLAQNGTGGSEHDGRLFDRARLMSPATRFILAGIVNRMDRGHVAADRCGEIRMIYRPVIGGDGETPARRLPMTLNLVLRATGGGVLPCRAVARSWLAVENAASNAAQALRLVAPGGPLATLGRASIDRLELNLQLGQTPRSVHADYLFMTFRFDQAEQRFREAPLENQIDRDRLLADRALGQEFKSWLLQPDNLAAFDRGTVVIPERFVARRAIAAAPAAFARDASRPAAGLAGPGTHAPLFAEAEIVAALQRAGRSGAPLRNIRSPAGFERRLNDITCTGCHQTRGIGGFHFSGVDWRVLQQSRQAAAPGSPHFLSDQQRRLGIVIALSNETPPDYTRGFADRPSPDGETDNGWGAHCGRVGARGEPDPSFATWGCAAGLSCQPAFSGSDVPIGMCFVGAR